MRFISLPLALGAVFACSLSAAADGIDPRQGRWAGFQDCREQPRAVTLELRPSARVPGVLTGTLRLDALGLHDRPADLRFDLPRGSTTVSGRLDSGAEVSTSLTLDGEALVLGGFATCPPARLSRTDAPAATLAASLPANVAATKAPAPSLPPLTPTFDNCGPYRELGDRYMQPHKVEDDREVAWFERYLAAPRAQWSEALFAAHAARATACLGVKGPHTQNDQLITNFMNRIVDHYRARVAHEEKVAALERAVAERNALPATLEAGRASGWWAPPAKALTTYGEVAYSSEEMRWFQRQTAEHSRKSQEAIRADIDAKAKALVAEASETDPKVRELVALCYPAHEVARACQEIGNDYQIRLSNLRCAEAVGKSKIAADLLGRPVLDVRHSFPLETVVCEAGRRGLQVQLETSGMMAWKKEKLGVADLRSGKRVGGAEIGWRDLPNGSKGLTVGMIDGTGSSADAGNRDAQRFVDCVMGRGRCDGILWR